MEILKCTNGKETPVTPLPPTEHKQNLVDYDAYDAIDVTRKVSFSEYRCCVCRNFIEFERIGALKVLRKKPENFNCFGCAIKNDYKVKGFYQGFPGHNLIITRAIGNEEHLAKMDDDGFVPRLLVGEEGYVDY